MAKIPKSLILILVLGLLLRLINLGQSFWLDEASQAVMSSHSPSWIWFSRGNDFHPPLYYLLIHFWMIFGRSEVWLRLPSVFFGVANILVLYLLVRELRLVPGLVIHHFTFRPETVAAILLAINPYHIYYSQELRSYILLCLLGTLSMYYLIKNRFRSLTLINTLLIYTHYSSLFLLVTQLIYLFVYHRRQLPKFLLSCLISALFYLPWLPQLTRQLISGTNIDTYLPGWRSLLSLSAMKTLPVTLFKLVAGRINLQSPLLYSLYIGFVFLVVFSAFRVADQKRRLLFTWSFVPIILMIITSFFVPQSQPFRVIFVIPALTVIFTQSCLRYPRLFSTLFIYIAVFGNVMYFTRPRLQREQWRQAIVYLKEKAGLDTGIVVKFSDKFSPFYWYDPALGVVAAVPVFPAQTPQVASKLAYLSDNVTIKNVYLLDYLTDITDPRRNVENVLGSLGFTLTNTRDFPGVGFIRHYQRI